VDDILSIHPCATINMHQHSCNTSTYLWLVRVCKIFVFMRMN
jgi:hypothetical protein